jgi:hypothetical protein
MPTHKGAYATVHLSLDALSTRSIHHTGKGQVRPRPQKDQDGGLKNLATEPNMPDSSWL